MIYNMAKRSQKNRKSKSLIVVNKQAHHNYYMHESFTAGISLAGWEVKSLRIGKGQLINSYVLIKDGEAWLIGAQITPLDTVSNHVSADPLRDRKLLLHKKELIKLFSIIKKQSHTCVANKLYWQGHLVKCQISLAQGKKKFDKRAVTKEREWNIAKQRIMHRNQ